MTTSIDTSGSNKKMVRSTRIVTDAEAVAGIADGMTIAVGGFINSGHPMSLVRELLRRDVRGLTVVGAASAGLEVDMMIAAGVADTVVTPYVGAEGLSSVGPAFRAAAQNGLIKIVELDEAHYYAGLRAAAQGLPFNPWRAGLGTSLPDLNPGLKVFNDPIHNQPLLAVPAIEIDVAFLHAAYSDAYGNVQHRGTRYGDPAIAAASDHVVVSVEQIVPIEAVRANPAATSIPGADQIVRAPFGSHPFSADGFYAPDRAHLLSYVDAASAWLSTGSRMELDRYLDTYVYQPADHVEYLELVGFRQILDLHEF